MMTDFQQQIGPFRLYSEIGRTPISNRYRAVDGRSGQTVVVHILTAESAQQPQLVEQFLTIGRQAMRLRHPGIIPVVDTGEAQGFVYIATPWIRGQSLAERLRRTGHALDLETIAYVLNALAAMLDYAHSQGFIHGHITPEQIYITDDNAILLDGFAEAGRVHPSTAPQNGDHSDQPLNSPLVFISPFIAPEQTKSGHAFDFRADIYSLGAVLYTMLLGRPPFAAETPDELLLQVAEKQPTPPESINPALPAAMLYVLKLVLAKDPAARYAKASEFATAFLQSSQWRPTTPVVEPADTQERRRLSAIVLLPLAAVLLILIGMGLGLFGEQFAFFQSTANTGLIAQLRGLVVPSKAVAELTAEPIVTPATETPTAASTTALPQTANVEVAQLISDTASTTATLTLTPTPASPTTTVGSAAETPTVGISTDMTATTTTLSTTLVTTATEEPATSTTPTESTSVIIDPLGLLDGTVMPGDLIINGTAEPGASIQLQVNGRNSGTTVTKSSGTWSLIIGLDQPGDYEIAAQVLDSTGRVTGSARQTVTVIAAVETATAVVTPTPPATATSAVTATATATTTPTPLPLTATATATAQPTPTSSNTPVPTATKPPQPSATNTALPTATRTPQPTATNTVMPTATHTTLPTATNTPRPTNTPLPTATNTARPSATSTPVPPPTNTPRPPATNTPVPPPTNTARPSATSTPVSPPTNTPRPSATNTPLPPPTNTLRPMATNTRTPTATNTPRPSATSTPVPPPTNTLRPTTTNTPVPTATNTPAPTATNTLPPPTATNTPAPTATYTPLPPPTNTRTPTATNTPAPTATPTAPSGSVALVVPSDGESGNGQRQFAWSANFTPAEGYAFELVFWRPGQEPMANGFGMAAPTTNLNVTLDLARLDEQLGELFDTGEYHWGILLVRTTPTYERVKYLGGGSRFIYYRAGSSDSGGQSSGE